MKWQWVLSVTRDEWRLALAAEKYIADEALLSAIYHSQRDKRPLLLEGAKGTGKTELAVVIGRILGLELIELRCYHGMGREAIGEFDYQKQRLYAELVRGRADLESVIGELWSERFFLPGPIMRALRAEREVVLLVDEIDKTDDRFESYFLELLSAWKVTIPYLGTVRARTVPRVIITSNRSRELTLPFKGRCNYVYLEYPNAMRIFEILSTRLELKPDLLRQIAGFALGLFTMNLRDQPSIREIIFWGEALEREGAERLTREAALDTISILIKNRSDAIVTADSLDMLIASAEQVFEAFSEGSVYEKAMSI